MMTTLQQAELERVARAWLMRHGYNLNYGTDGEDTKPYDHDVRELVALLAAQRKVVLEQTCEQTITAAIREADIMFEKVGGSTRHYVRDCLLPIMKKHGLIVVRDLDVVF